MTTPVSLSLGNRAWPQVEEETRLPQESLEVTAPVAPPLVSAPDEQASLKAEFELLECHYYKTVQRTNGYSNIGQVQSELDAAYRSLTDFAEKHPEFEYLLPRNPFASTTNDCAIS